ncbi:MAG: outer membrane beta-barrel protein, partial [Cyclobacteriaceae bacterium]|nr:outer membrane beta-barrel protein [Cyclobacteriaceae bacterium]
MKHLSTSLLLGLFISLSCSAQLLVGPVVGGSVSKVFFFDNQFRYESSPTMGYDLGVMASMRVHKNFVLNGQLLYSQRGRQVKGIDDLRSDSKFDLYSSMQYIELPLFYVLEFKKNTGAYSGQGGQTKTYNWFIGGGPVVSYWLSNSGTIKSSYLLENNIESLDYTTVFGKTLESSDPVADSQIEGITDPNRFQFGLNLTGGFAFQPVGANKIVTSVHVY